MFINNLFLPSFIKDRAPLPLSGWSDHPATSRRMFVSMSDIYSTCSLMLSFDWGRELLLSTMYLIPTEVTRQLPQYWFFISRTYPLLLYHRVLGCRDLDHEKYVDLRTTFTKLLCILGKVQGHSGDLLISYYFISLRIGLLEWRKRSLWIYNQLIYTSCAI